MELLTCTIVTSDTVNNYANTQNGRLLLISTVYCWLQSKKIPASLSLQTKKISLKLYFDMIFIPDLGRNF